MSRKWTEINESMAVTREADIEFTSDMSELDASLAISEAVSFAAEGKYIAEGLFKDILSFNKKAEEREYSVEEYISEAFDIKGVFKKVIDFIIKIFKSMINFIVNMYNKATTGVKQSRATALVNKMIDGTKEKFKQITESPAYMYELTPINATPGNVGSMIEEMTDIDSAASLLYKHMLNDSYGTNSYGVRTKLKEADDKVVNFETISMGSEDSFHCSLYTLRYLYITQSLKMLVSSDKMAPINQYLNDINNMWKDLDKPDMKLTATTNPHTRVYRNIGTNDYILRDIKNEGINYEKYVLDRGLRMARRTVHTIDSTGDRGWNDNTIYGSFIPHSNPKNSNDIYSYFMKEYEAHKKRHTKRESKLSDVKDYIGMIGMRVKYMKKYNIIDTIKSAAKELEGINKRVEMMSKSIDPDGVGVNDNMTTLNAFMNGLKDTAVAYQTVFTALIQSLNSMVIDMYTSSVNAFNLYVKELGFFGLKSADKFVEKK